ncbi:hypothetical protein ACTXT7_009432 [Hymenolepis weldensis]
MLLFLTELRLPLLASHETGERGRDQNFRHRANQTVPKPKHHLLLFKIKRRPHYLIHANPLPALKPYNFNPTTTIPINLPTSSQTPSQSTKLQTIKHKMQPSSSPIATLSRKFNTWNLLAVNDKSKSGMERTPKEEITDV